MENFDIERQRSKIFQLNQEYLRLHACVKAVILCDDPINYSYHMENLTLNASIQINCYEA